MAATNATAIALVFGSICAMVGSIACWQLDFARIFGLEAAVPRAEVNSLLLALSILLGFGFPANVPKFVLIGMMQGQTAYSIELVGIAVAAAALLVAIHLQQSLAVLAVAFLGPQYFLMIVGGGVKLYLSNVPVFSRTYFVRDKFFVMLHEGWKLALGQASFAIASHTDLTLISVVVGAAAAAPYGVAQRVFGVPIMFLSMGNDALWPALAKADANGESRWVRRAYLYTLVTMALTSMTAGIGIWFLYEPLTRLWLGTRVETDPLLLFGMAVYIVLTMVVHTTATLLRSMGMTTVLTRALVAMMLLNIPMSIALIYLIGSPGAIWGTIISYIVCLVIPFVKIIPPLLSQREAVDNKGET
ncbi:polysaccharide biosynthesis C-terminal domain-containing protein [Mesorhizobium sp. M0199]|uniref:lipopolysaccharide biosynthesis protein n=1 Tax=Mesorhizobium sp. M0199 TaxID=2956911 RepID=UPI00333CB9C8